MTDAATTAAPRISATATSADAPRRIAAALRTYASDESAQTQAPAATIAPVGPPSASPGPSPPRASETESRRSRSSEVRDPRSPAGTATRRSRDRSRRPAPPASSPPAATRSGRTRLGPTMRASSSDAAASDPLVDGPAQEEMRKRQRDPTADRLEHGLPRALTDGVSGPEAQQPLHGAGPPTRADGREGKTADRMGPGPWAWLPGIRPPRPQSQHQRGPRSWIEAAARSRWPRSGANSPGATSKQHLSGLRAVAGDAPVASLPVPESPVLVEQVAERGPRQIADVEADLEPHCAVVGHPPVQTRSPGWYRTAHPIRRTDEAPPCGTRRGRRCRQVRCAHLSVPRETHAVPIVERTGDTEVPT